MHQKSEQSEENPLGKTTVPVNQKKTLPLGKPIQNTGAKMGIGFFYPNYVDFPTLYFYGDVTLDKSHIEHFPTDSVVFANDHYNNPTTTYSPPWLYPEHLKLDYGIMIFKVLGIGNDFIKVEGNKQNNQLTYLDKRQGKFFSWAEFILSVNSVEFINKDSQSVHIKPLDIADPIKVDFVFMQPLLVEEDWMYVRLTNMNFAEKGKGWIRWRKENQLLIRYSLLS
jgi:hypothetical protein